MRNHVLFVAVILLLFKGILLAQGPGSAAVPFLLIAPGAKAGGMGETGVALATDATAIFWNPAGLAYQYDDPEFDTPGEASFMHSQWLPQFNFNDLFYEYIAARYYFEDIGMVGLAATILNLGESVHTDENNNVLGTFNSQEYAITLAYATKLEENLGIGVNVKVIRSELSPVEVGAENRQGFSTGSAVDLGVMWEPDYEVLENKLRIGANLSNLGPSMSYIDEKQADPLPTTLRLGAAYKVLDDEFNRVIVTYETTRLLVNRDSTDVDDVLTAVLYSSWVEGRIQDRLHSFTHALGVEYWYGNFFALRTGYFYEHKDFGNRKFLTFGAGIVYDIFGIDFGYISDNEESPLADTMRFSFAVKF